MVMSMAITKPRKLLIKVLVNDDEYNSFVNAANGESLSSFLREAGKERISLMDAAAPATSKKVQKAGRAK